MSDGPHRSLKMRQGWKNVAKFADKRAFAPEEISNAVIPALGQDWRTDVSEALARRISDVLGDQQDTLFSDHKVMSLEALRPMAAGHGLAQVLIDCAIQQAMNGSSGQDAAIQAAKDALNIFAASCARQVEEHYCRESSMACALNVRDRIEQGIGGATIDGLARQLLQPESRPVPRAPSWQTGLDDGVRL